MEIYKLNSIPCVYIYPENLGIIKYIFDKRIQVVLSNPSLKKRLRRYRLFKLRNSGEFQMRAVCILGAAAIVISKSILIENKRVGDYYLLITISLVCVYQLFKLFKLYNRIFRQNKFTLDMLED